MCLTVGFKILVYDYWKLINHINTQRLRSLTKWLSIFILYTIQLRNIWLAILNTWTGLDWYN